MKKFLLFFVTMMICISAAWTQQFSAINNDGKTIYYSVIDSATSQVAVVESPDSYCGTINIPASVEHNGTTYSVTAIGESAFAWCNELIKVTLPNSITQIGKSAFWICEELTEINIPNSVTTIGESAFFKCMNITSINIPNNIIHIEDHVFSFCTNIKSFKIPDSVTTIGESAFQGCTNLKSITLPNSIKTIGNSAFCCSGLTSIVIPDSVTSLNGETFEACNDLISVTIPKSVVSIGYCDFFTCPKLKQIIVNGIKPPQTFKDGLSFGEYPEDIIIYVPCESLNDYKNDKGWNVFTNIQCKKD